MSRLHRVSIQRVMTLHSSGLSSAEIADQIGCSDSYIRRILRSRGVSPANWRKPLPPPEEIRRQYRKLGSLDKLRAHYGVALYRIVEALNIGDIRHDSNLDDGE